MRPSRDDPPLDVVQQIRERRLLPSDLLDMARQNNPGLTLDFDYEWSGPLVLVVTTARGKLTYHREPHEDWYSLFSRLGFLQR